MPAELRRGSGGVTCQAEEIGSGRDVALELVPAASLKTEMREQAEAEALAAKQLSHINIPILYDFGFEDDDLVYVTEYFDGITTEAWVTAHGPMPMRAVLHIALQVVSALGAATFHLIVHRAIHPGNLLIVPGQTAEGDWPLIKVLNFGRVLMNFRKTEETNARNKFAPFASPEQLEHGTVDFRSEIYSLGCTLWSLLTGVSPFNAPGKPVAAAQMAPAMKRFRGVPKKIGRLIAEMVSINPDERPLDPVVMTQQLQECLLHVERREAITRRFGIPATWQRRRVARPARRLSLRPIAVAALLITAALLATLFLPERFRPDALWQRMTRRESIGIPIGIREATTKPVIAQQRSAAKPNETQPLTSATSSMSSEAAANGTANDANVVPVATASPIVASANQNNVTPSQSESPSSPKEA